MKFGEAVSTITGTAQNAVAADLADGDKFGLWRTSIASPNQFWNISWLELKTALAGAGAFLVEADIGVSVQAYDADLAAWAGVNPASYSTTAQIAAAYQPLDADLTAIAALGFSAASLLRKTAANTYDLIAITTAGANLLDDVDNTAQRTTLGLGTSATVNTGTSGATIPLLNGVNTWSGRQSNTTQPAFLVMLSATASNVTGDGTAYTVAWDSETFDQASNYSSNVFTAPVGGRYQLSVFIQLEGVAAGHDRISLLIVTSNRTYFLDWGDVAPDVNGRVGMVMTVLADMDANDTAAVQAGVSGSTKVVDVLGGTSTVSSQYSGYLVA